MTEEKTKNHAITVRIDSDMESELNFIAENILNEKKGNVIRKFLSLAEILAINNDGSIRGYNNRLLMILKKETIQRIISKVDEELQVDFGDEMARYINDICRLKGESTLEYKLRLCNRLGWLVPFYDKNFNTQIPHDFGPEDFVKAFCYRLVNEKKMNLKYLSTNLTSDKAAKKEFERIFGKGEKGENAISNHYSFTFMHLREK